MAERDEHPDPGRAQRRRPQGFPPDQLGGTELSSARTTTRWQGHHNRVVPFAFVRPSDPALLAGRPLLDLGTGDGQTVRTLAPDGFVVGLDRTPELLRASGLARAVCSEATALPLSPGSFRTILAADLFHHLDNDHLGVALAEVRRVLRPDGVLVAWWYASPGRPAP